MTVPATWRTSFAPWTRNSPLVAKFSSEILSAMYSWMLKARWGIESWIIAWILRFGSCKRDGSGRLSSESDIFQPKGGLKSRKESASMYGRVYE